MLSSASTSTPLEVRALEGNEEAWRDYVERHPSASLYHRLEIRDIIQDTFGHRSRYLMACGAGGVRGVLPLVEMKSRLFGHFLVSLPFFNYGGIVADDVAAERLLAAEAARIAGETGARHIELRQAKPLGIPWAVRRHKVAMVTALAGDPETHWCALSSRMRGKIRKARKAGARFVVTASEGLDDFYGVFARNMRDLGTPVYPRRLFESVFTLLGSSARLFLVHLEERPVAGAVGLCHGQDMELPWICSNYDYSRSHVNEFLYWSVLEWACGQSLRSVDLGRSSAGSGPYRFKTQWKPEERPLYWYYWTAPGAPLPQLNPENPKYRLAIRCWRKLPLGVANLLGPHIVRNIP